MVWGVALVKTSWIDVSRALEPGMPVWPGDPPVRLERLFDRERGDACTVSHLSATVHAGTHVDAPRHYVQGGAGVDEMPLAICIGAARVVEVAAHSPLPADAFAGQRIAAGQRVLLRAADAPRSAAASAGSKGVRLSVAAARFLASRRVSLVGVDGMSVGPADEEGDEVHRVLLGAGVWVLEGLDLSGVRPGRFKMVCLPLRLPGADGSPARVLLRPIPAWRSR